jgi:hypothetical protein
MQAMPQLNKLMGRNELRDLDVNGRTILLKPILNNQFFINSVGSGLDHVVGSCCKQENELSTFLKDQEFLDKLGKY